jgi:nicotinate-nucleotide adenylyltransferase
MRAGVFGGTFDPVHVGHLVLAERAREALSLERVVWVPAGDPWRKGERAVSAPAHRVEMVRLAIAGNPAFELSTVETERAGPSYSAETLAALAEARPGAELFLLLGLDALEDLTHWHEPHKILELAKVAAAAREGRRLDAYELDAMLLGLGARTVWFEMPRLDISATELRARAAAGGSLRYLVPDAVEAYIREQGLYGAPAAG